MRLPLCGQISCFVVVQYCDSLFCLSNCLTSTGRDDSWPNPLLTVCDTDLRRWLPKDDQDWFSAQIHCQSSAFVWQVLRKYQVICIFTPWQGSWGSGKISVSKYSPLLGCIAIANLAIANLPELQLRQWGWRMGIKQIAGRALPPLSLWLFLLLFFLLCA